MEVCASGGKNIQVCGEKNAMKIHRGECLESDGGEYWMKIHGGRIWRPVSK